MIPDDQSHSSAPPSIISFSLAQNSSPCSWFWALWELDLQEGSGICPAPLGEKTFIFRFVFIFRVRGHGIYWNWDLLKLEFIEIGIYWNWNWLKLGFTEIIFFWNWYFFWNGDFLKLEFSEIGVYWNWYFLKLVFIKTGIFWNWNLLKLVFFCSWYFLKSEFTEIGIFWNWYFLKLVFSKTGIWNGLKLGFPALTRRDPSGPDQPRLSKLPGAPQSPGGVCEQRGECPKKAEMIFLLCSQAQVQRGTPN